MRSSVNNDISVILFGRHAGISSLLQCLGRLSQPIAHSLRSGAIGVTAALGIAVGPIYQRGALKNHTEFNEVILRLRSCHGDCQRAVGGGIGGFPTQTPMTPSLAPDGNPRGLTVQLMLSLCAGNSYINLYWGSRPSYTFHKPSSLRKKKPFQLPKPRYLSVVLPKIRQQTLCSHAGAMGLLRRPPVGRWWGHWWLLTRYPLVPPTGPLAVAVGACPSYLCFWLLCHVALLCDIVSNSYWGCRPV